MPDLFLLGGPNGVGKSTHSSGFKKWHDIPIIDPDKIVKELQQAGSPLFTADRVIQDRIMDHIKNKRSFVMESNLDVPMAYGYVHYGKEQGYNTHLIYMGVDDQNILNKRIAERTKFSSNLIHYGGLLPSYP